MISENETENTVNSDNNTESIIISNSETYNTIFSDNKIDYTQLGGAGETSALLSKFANYTVRNPPTYNSAFLIPIWNEQGRFYGLFGLNKKNEITPLGGMAEVGEIPIKTALREFIEETINGHIPSRLYKTLGDISKKANHYKFLYRNQVYYVTNANILANPQFHTFNGSINNNNNIINLSKFSNNNRFNVSKFIMTRGFETRKPKNGLYEMKCLIGIDLIVFRNYIMKNQGVSGLKYGYGSNKFVIRGDLKRSVLSGLFNFVK